MRATLDGRVGHWVEASVPAEGVDKGDISTHISRGREAGAAGRVVEEKKLPSSQLELPEGVDHA